MILQIFSIILIISSTSSLILPRDNGDPCSETDEPKLPQIAETLPFEPTSADLSVETSDQKIIGGQNASPGEFPFIVSVQVSQPGSLVPTYRQYCDGSIINSQWILTAAHCCGLAFTRYKIVAGGYDQSKLSGKEQESFVIKALRHPDYNERTIDNDICLMRLAKELKFVDVIQPVQFRKIEPPEKGNALTGGWGITTNNATTTPPILQKIILPLIPKEKCQEIYAKINPITRSMICAGFEEGKNVCHGDSGGPLMCTDENGQKFQCGITSWGVGCAFEGFPGVFTNVGIFSDWIECVTNHSFMCNAITALG